THQRRVKHLGPVRCRQQHDALARIEAVEFGKELVQRLLLLVMAAAIAARTAASASQRIELVDEDDAGSGLARLLEQIPDPGSADADEHLDELGAGNGEERYPRLAGNRPREQGLAGARRADQKNALGDPCAEPAVLLLVLEEVDNLLELGLGLVDPRHVVE